MIIENRTKKTRRLIFLLLVFLTNNVFSHKISEITLLERIQIILFQKRMKQPQRELLLQE